MLGPPLLIGEKVFYTKHGFIASGTVKWLGRLQEVFGNQMVAGILMVRKNFPDKKIIFHYSFTVGRTLGAWRL